MVTIDLSPGKVYDQPMENNFSVARHWEIANKQEIKWIGPK